jgi:hypothetical protein
VTEVEVAAIFNNRCCDDLSVLLLELAVADSQLALRKEVKIEAPKSYTSLEVLWLKLSSIDSRKA